LSLEAEALKELVCSVEVLWEVDFNSVKIADVYGLEL
jgi:hypothetical protein